MAEPKDWREGARVNDPRDKCPNCGGQAMFASDFKKFGHHQVRVCVKCGVFDNGKWQGDVEVTP